MGSKTSALLRVVDSAIHRLHGVLRVCGVAVAAMAFTTPRLLPEVVAHDILRDLEGLPAPSFTSSDHAVIAQMMQDSQSTIEILGTMTAIKKLIQLTAEHPDRLGHMIPCLFSTMSEMEKRFPQVHRSFNTSKQEWMGIKDKMSTEHKIVASGVVRTLLERTTRQTMEDMCKHQAA